MSQAYLSLVTVYVMQIVHAFCLRVAEILTSLCDVSIADATRVKELEKTTNHDVKAIEYFIKEKIQHNSVLKKCSEFVHFGCTSEDVNNLAYGLILGDSMTKVIIPLLEKLVDVLVGLAKKVLSWFVSCVFFLF